MATSTTSSAMAATAAAVPSSSSSSSSSAGQHHHQAINLNIKTTTGGNFDVTVDPNISVENLKKIIAKKLKVAKDRIRLLHRERELQDGSLKDNSLMDGSKIILIPNVETGLLAQRPENTVMQALESLNDSQVNDFLSGKTPLNLSMRLGDHMMLIQLQLSTVNPANGGGSNGNGATTSSSNSHHHHSSSNGTSCGSSSRMRANSQRSARFGSVTSLSSNGSSTSSSSSSSASSSSHHHHHHHHHHRTSLQQQLQQQLQAHQQQQQQQQSVSASSSTTSLASSVSTSSSNLSLSSSASSVTSTTPAPNAASTTTATTSLRPSLIKSSDLSSFLSKRDYESLQNIVKSIAMSQPGRLAAAANNANNEAATTAPTNQQRYSIVRAPSLKPTKSVSCFQLGEHAAANTANEGATAMLEQSPIKSLSNLVSSSAIETMAPTNASTTKNIPTNAATAAAAAAANITSNNVQTIAVANSTVTPMITCQDPIAAKLTSCLCTRLNATAKSSNSLAIKNCHDSSSCLSRQDVAQQQQQRANLALTSSKSNPTVVGGVATAAANSPAALHKTANNPIMRSKHRHHHHHHHHHHHYHQNGVAGAGIVANSSSNSTTNSNAASTAILRQKLPSIARALPIATNTPNISNVSNDSGFASDDSMLGNAAAATAAAAAATTTTPAATNLDDNGFISTDTRTLAEASRNLTQTLRKLSKEVFTNKIELSNGDDAPRKSGSGAVIESMKNHGKGIYSGTFSGTLNPALQDRYGRPKRDISTVIHILNDLLSATPQYSRGARISFETPTSSSSNAASSSSSSAVGGSAASTSNASSSSRSKQYSSKHGHGSSHTHCLKCFKASVHGHAQATNATNNSNNSSSSSANCAYGECDGHYTSSSVNGKSTSAARTSHYACCTNASSGQQQQQQQQQHHHHHHHHHHQQHNHNVDANDRSVCSCRYRMQTDGETGEQEREHTCQKCLSEMENLRTKSKLDQLRLVMQQRKQKREARKLNSAPYGARVVANVNGGGGSTSGIEMTNEPTTSSAATVLASPAPAAAAAAAATTPTSTKTTTLNNANSSNNNSNATTAPLTTAPPSEVSPNHIVEEVDTAA